MEAPMETAEEAQNRTPLEMHYASFWDPKADVAATQRAMLKANPALNPRDITGQMVKKYQVMVSANHREAIANGLADMAETLGRELKPGALRVYTAIMETWTPQQCVQALTQATVAGRYFPSPAELMEFAGVTGSRAGAAVEAQQALRTVIEAIRHHGTRLRPIPGRIVREKDENGRVLQVPEREPATPVEKFPLPVEKALEAIGFGNFWAGVDFIAAHPALMTSQNDVQTQFARREAQAIEQRWAEAYSQAKG